MTEPSPPTPAIGAGQLTAFKSRGFFPADFAAVESGKLYVCGAYWSMLRFSAFPAVLPSMSLVAVIEVPFHANHADHSLLMRLVDLDEQPLGLHVEGAFRAAPPIEHRYGQPGVTPVAVPIQGLTLEGPGEYSFTLAVDEHEIDRYRFSVVQFASVALMQGLPTPPTPPDPPSK